jgi:hypothetical protein
VTALESDVVRPKVLGLADDSVEPLSVRERERKWSRECTGKNGCAGLGVADEFCRSHWATLRERGGVGCAGDMGGVRSGLSSGE